MESIKWSRIFFQKPKLPIAICLAIFLFCLYYISIIKSASNGHEITEYETENTPEYKSAQLGSSNNEHIKELLEELRFYNELDSSRQKNGSYASENIRKDPRDGGTYRLPQVLVIGSKKCGTGTLKFFLGHHPSVAGDKHESHFFDRDKTYSRGLDWYKNQLPKAHSGQVVMEGTPAYFHTPGVPERIKRMNESIKILLILRDPVIRLISDYTHVDEMGVRRLHDFMTPNRVREMETVFGPNTYPDFEWLIFGINGEVDTELQLVTNGLYAEHLKRYLRHFSMDQIHVIDGDTFGKYPWKELSLVEKFLNIDPYLSEDRFSFNAEKGFYCLKTSSGEACLGKDKGRTHPDVNPTSIEKLKQFYRPHNEELFKMLNKKFEW